MVQTTSLKNGLRVVLEEIPYVRSISFGIWVENGSRNESAKTNGISHFIEHMLFKGTQKRSAKQIAEEMDCLGGQINAYTTKEYTCYHTRILDKHFDRALDVMADMFLHSKFSQEDIEKERKVILEEINMYEDAPEEVVHDALQEAIWKSCSLGQPILGVEESISNFTRQTFLDYFSQNYQPCNTVISVVGNFNSDEILKKIDSYFGDWDTKTPFHHQNTKTVYTPSVLKRPKDIEQVHLCFAFPCFQRGSEYKYALSVLSTILGGGMSSRLFQKIREEHGLAYSIYSYTGAYLDAGLFAIYAALNPEQAEKMAYLVAQELFDLKTNPLSEKVLETTKEQIISNFIIGTESTVSRMTTAGASVLLRNKIQSPEEVIQRIEEITKEDILEIAVQIFDFDKVSISASGNVEQLDMEQLKQVFLSFC